MNLTPLAPPFPKGEGGKNDDDVARLATQPPVVRFLNTIITEAVRNRASDIHLEPRSDGLYVRYRIDGVLRTTATPVDQQFSRGLIARVKVLANLNLAENRLAQDGRFSETLSIVEGQDSIVERLIDFRVSVLPTYHGEKAVLRLLDKASVLLTLDQLGFQPEMQRQFEEILKLPQGMILVTGPTGSGKSTTLYAALNFLKSEEMNVVTIEDPIEYQVEGVNQTQIHPKIGVTFANQLRAIVRQDPDVILVGEIRDAETAEMAFRGALTGHLVLSTLHTSDTASAITRLLDIGVEPYLISSSIVAIVAQRLVRLLCASCMGERCDECSNAGYKGRTGLFELMLLTEELQQAILRRATAGELRQLSRKSGLRSLQDEGAALLSAGRTSSNELRRVLHTLK